MFIHVPTTTYSVGYSSRASNREHRNSYDIFWHLQWRDGKRTASGPARLGNGGASELCLYCGNAEDAMAACGDGRRDLVSLGTRLLSPT